MSGIVAVIFDWAGTLVDYGSRAPMGAFVETFAEFGVAIRIEEARGPMGMAKRPHIATLCALPRVRAAWATRHGRAPDESDIDALYEVFVPKNVAVAAAYAEPVLRNSKFDEHYQFLRKGYFYLDKDSSEEKMSFNRTTTLRDNWAKEQKKG